MLRNIQSEELTVELFSSFRRFQQVTKCWRKIDGRWTVVDNPFVEDWGSEQYEFLVRCLRSTLASGGLVCGAFAGGVLKGFVSVESHFFGSKGQYLELSSIHVSSDCRGHGIGRQLMETAQAWAREQGAKKLYISAHSSVESQAFYHAMGCREAEEISALHVEKEPCDCQLELSL